PVRRAVPLAPVRAQADRGHACVLGVGAVPEVRPARPGRRARAGVRHAGGQDLECSMSVLLATHAQAKEALLRQLRVLADLAGAAGMKTLRADLIDTRIPKLEDERFHLVVLGEFNHGKSTFVNALLGADVLPTGITPTTAAINHVVYADKPRAKAV